MSQIKSPNLQSIFQVRPRFKINVHTSTERLQTQFKAHLEKEAATCVGFVNHSFGTISLPIKEQHYWSPQLSFTFEPSETAENQMIIRGLFGPRPTVWTMFLFFYALIIFVIFVISIIGLSYWSLGKSMLILWWIPVLVVLYASLFLVAYSGQKLGHQQMETLNDFFEEVVKEIEN
jgi:hypothetical protein